MNQKNSPRFLFIALAVTLGSAPQAFSGVVSFTCNANIDNGTCTTLNGTIANLYSSTFTNATASIYIEYGTTGLGQSLQYYDNASYSAYSTALTANISGANDVTAVASLGGTTTNPVNGTSGVAITSALRAALGIAGGTGTDSSDNACTLGSAGCYNGHITLTDAANTFYYRSGSQDPATYDFFSVVEHEVNEILGTSSCIRGNSPASIATSINCTNGTPPVGVSAADLFRYSSAGTRSDLTTANGTTAYFSIDGGTTNIAGYNNSPNGADYGDWDGSSARVQNAYGSPGTHGSDITNDGGSEIAVLDAVGYNLVAVTPEPGTIGMLGSGLALLAGLGYRRRRG